MSLATWKQAKPSAGDEEDEIVNDPQPLQNEDAEKGKEIRNSGSSDTGSDDEYPAGRDWLAIINPKSGGQSGASVLKQFKESKLLPHDQIFSLVPDGPAAALKRWQEDPERFKLIVCGGDGTVGWVLTAIDKLQVKTDPIVGVIPLGTGNDLARVFGWGGGYSGEKLDRILKQFAKAKVLKLDRWDILVTPTEQYDPEKHNKPDEDVPAEANDSDEESEEEQEAEKVKERKKESREDQQVKLESQTFVMNNYFSVGVDAEIALSFHKMREANSGLFQHQLINKGWYGVLGGVAAVTPHGALRKHITLEVDGKEITIPNKVRGLIVLNLPSYAGGTQPWGKGSKKDKNQYADPAINDVLLEVVGIKGAMHLARIQTHTSARGGIRLAQGKSLKLTVRRALPAQVDGEPWMMPPCVVKVSHLNQASLLYNLSAKGAEKKEKSLTK